MLREYKIVKQDGNVLLLERPDGKRTVVSTNKDETQVYDAMPTDGPTGGGQWMSNFTDAGVDYVANWYSKGYANRIFREYVTGEYVERFM